MEKLKPYIEEDVISSIEKLKSKLYDFSANLERTNMNMVRRAIVQACIENAISDLNTAVHTCNGPGVYTGR